MPYFLGYGVTNLIIFQLSGPVKGVNIFIPKVCDIKIIREIDCNNLV